MRSPGIVNAVPLIAINLYLREDKYGRLLEKYKELGGGRDKKPSQEVIRVMGNAGSVYAGSAHTIRAFMRKS